MLEELFELKDVEEFVNQIYEFIIEEEKSNKKINKENKEQLKDWAKRYVEIKIENLFKILIGDVLIMYTKHLNNNKDFKNFLNDYNLSVIYDFAKNELYLEKLPYPKKINILLTKTLFILKFRRYNFNYNISEFTEMLKKYKIINKDFKTFSGNDIDLLSYNFYYQLQKEFDKINENINSKKEIIQKLVNIVINDQSYFVKQELFYLIINDDHINSNIEFNLYFNFQNLLDYFIDINPMFLKFYFKEFEKYLKEKNMFKDEFKELEKSSVFYVGNKISPITVKSRLEPYIEKIMNSFFEERVLRNEQFIKKFLRSLEGFELMKESLDLIFDISKEIVDKIVQTILIQEKLIDTDLSL